MSYRAQLNKKYSSMKMWYLIGTAESSLTQGQVQPVRKPPGFTGVIFAGDSDTIQAYP